MRNGGSIAGQKLRAAILVGGALALAGLAGCGSSDSDSVNSQIESAQEEAQEVIDKAQKQGNEAIEKAQKQLKDADIPGQAEDKVNEAQKRLEEAQDKVNEASKQAQEGVEAGKEYAEKYAP